MRHTTLISPTVVTRIDTLPQFSGMRLRWNFSLVHMIAFLLTKSNFDCIIVHCQGTSKFSGTRVSILWPEVLQSCIRVISCTVQMYVSHNIPSNNADLTQYAPGTPGSMPPGSGSQPSVLCQALKIMLILKESIWSPTFRPRRNPRSQR